MKLKKRVPILFYLSIFGVILMQSCIKGTDFEEDEQNQINEYLIANNITIEPKESGLYYIENQAGNGVYPEYGDSATINYIGKRLTGYVFDTNIEDVAKEFNIWDIYAEYKPYTFLVGDSNLIGGLSEGVSYMSVGANASILLPSKLAFLDYTPVVFNIDLLSIKKAGE